MTGLAPRKDAIMTDSEKKRRVQAALDARNNRTASAAPVASRPSTGNSKVQRALEAREQRIRESMPDLLTDIGTRYKSAANAYNSTKAKYNAYDEVYKGQQEQRKELAELRAKVGAYSRYMDQKTAQELLAGLDQMGQGYDTYLTMSRYATEKAWNKALEDAQAKAKRKEEILSAPDFEELSQYASTVGDRKLVGYFTNNHMDETYEYINDQNGARKKITGNTVGTGSMGALNNREFFDRQNLSEMTQEEVSIYNYLYAQEGKESAEEYINSIREDLNMRRGGEIAQEVRALPGIVRVPAMAAVGLGAGGDQFFTGTQQFFTGEKLPTTAVAQANSDIYNSLDGFGQQLYSATNVIGNMAPSILVSSLAQAAGLPAMAAQGLGAATMGVSAAGNAYADALEKGYDKGVARIYSTLVGAAEGGLQYALGGIGKLGGVTTQKIMSKVAMIDNSLLRIAAKLGVDFLGEVAEEEIQNFLEPALRSLILGEDYDLPTMEEILETAVVTAITTPLLGGVDTVREDIANTRYYRDTYGAVQQDLVGETLELTPDSKYAQKLQERLKGGKNLNGNQLGRLVQQNESAMVNRDREAIQKATEARLTELGETRDVTAVAAALTKEAAGEKLTRAERALVDGSKYGIRVEAEMDPNNAGTHAGGWTRDIGTERIRSDAYNSPQEATEQETDADVQAGNEAEKATAAAVEAPAQESARETAKTAEAPKEEAKEPEIAEDGVTRQISTGKAVTPKKIVSIENGKAVVETDGGNVSSEDIAFGDGDAAILWNTPLKLQGIDVMSANGIIKAYDGSIPVAKYMAGAAQEFRNGYNNLPFGGEMAASLDEKTREIIYEIGQKAAGRATAKAQAKATEAKRAGKQSTKEGKVVFDRKGRSFSDVQETALKTMEQLSRVLGVEFHVFESYEKDGRRVYVNDEGQEVDAPNGFYKDGKIYIDLNAGNDGKGTMLFTVAHELTHFIKEWSPAKFKILANLLVKDYTAKGQSVQELIDAQIAKAERSGRTIDEDEAFEEVVADSMEAILTDGNVVEFMATVKQQDQNLWEKIRQWFKDLAGDLRKLVDAYKGVKPDSREGRMVSQMQDVILELEAAYAQALDEAGENFRAAEENTAGEGGVKYSFAGTNAETADRSLLDRARQMEERGRDNEQIRKETGWFRGMDGKWRFEIDDSTAQVADEKINYMTLEDLLPNAEIFDAYPDMKNISVVFQSLEPGVNAQYNRQFDHIDISYKLKNDPDAIRGAVLHEIQHAIQNREGFTGGATVASWDRRIKSGFDSRKNSDIREARAAQELLQKIQEEDPEFYRHMMDLDAMAPDLPRGAVNWDTLEQIEEDPPQWQAYDARRDELEEIYGDRMWDFNSALYDLQRINKRPARTAEELYFDTAGEIEARNVAGRRNLTGEQRIITPPLLGNEDTVFAEGNTRNDQAIGKTTDNKPFVIVEKDILDGVAPTEWVKTVTDNIRQKFPQGIVIGRNTISVNQQSRRELTYSEYMHKMKKQNVQLYSDKLRATDSIDEIIKATTDWINEGLKHGRSDNIRDFARGNVLLRIGRNDYSAEVVVGTKENGTMLLYDILNLQKANISEKNTDASLTSESRESSTDRQLASDSRSNSIERNSPGKTVTQDVLDVKVKNTDNLNPTEDPDIRYSARDPEAQEVNRVLEKENAKLKEDVERLKELVQLQKQVTGGTKFTKTSLEAVARKMKKDTNAKGDTKELQKLLEDVYGHIAGDKELTWESVKEAAAPAVEWLKKHVQRDSETASYAKDVLKDIRNIKITLDENQRQEAASAFGSYGDYRKRLMGSVTLGNDGISLDSQWHAWAQDYPNIFDPNLSASDMPNALAEAIDRLRGMTEDGGYLYDEAFLEQELLRRVYDSYWNVSTLYTVADRYQKKIDKLKLEHSGKMNELRQEARDKLENLRQAHRAEVDRIRKAARANQEEQIRQIREQNQASRKKAVDSRRRTEERRKIRKTIMELKKILNHGNKKRNVKQGMRDFVETAIASAEVMFLDDYPEEAMIRNGVEVEVTVEENRLIGETKILLNQRDELFDTDRMAAEGVADVSTGDTSDVEARTEASAKLDRQIAKNMRQLKGVFERERNRIHKATVTGMLDNLAEAYRQLGESDDLYIRGAVDENVYQKLKSMGEDMKGDLVRDLDLEQLDKLHDAYKMVLHTVREANKLFAEGKAKSLQQTADDIALELGSRNIPTGNAALIAQKAANKFGWNYEKLYYALDRIGSKSFAELINRVADSEDTVMRDAKEAHDFLLETAEKYGYNDWNVNRELDRVFKDSTGREFKLTLGQMMALYAYSRRKNAWNHIQYGGFVFGKAALTNPRPADSYKLTREQCEAITNLLTPEQKAYAEEMQKYLSEVMGAKGNEVSMKLYGIEMFKEKNYFPIHVAGQFQAKAQETQAKEAAGFGSMSNAGFTQTQNPNAKAPFVLEAFNEVWADHVNEMARYHGAVPALEDLRRVMNRSAYLSDTEASTSIMQIMENHYGKEAVEYFDNLYREANSGAVYEKLQKLPKKLLGLFRKNSVAYSLSVLVQQPASIVRAYAMVDRKYFGIKGVGAISSGASRAIFRKEEWKKIYAEMLKYAPGVTLAKEIGGFDTASGGSIRQYLLDTGKSFRQQMNTGTAAEKAGAVMNLVDDNKVANLPNVADKIAWMEIWNACKRETAHNNPKLSTGSEEFMEKVGARFTEVIRATQVYDSIFAKSPMLKSKNLAVQYLVSFMNEPNTTANMAESALRDFGRKEVKQGVRKLQVLAHSIIFTGVMKSIVYAMRDDDEDEAFVEKYMEALAGSLMDDFNPMNYIPVARDVWSLAQGYDVERADMAIVSDAVDALTGVFKNFGTDTENMTEDQLVAFDKKCTQANWRLAESIATFLGIPMKNVRREIEGILDHARIARENSGKATWKSTWDKVYDAVMDSIPFASSSTKTEQLYRAVTSGDTEYRKRLESGYESESELNSALRKALRTHDPRVREAARALNSGDEAGYRKLLKEITGEGHFSGENVEAAIQTEAEKLAVADFVKEHPEADGITYAAVKAYKEASNVPVEVFYEAWQYKSGRKKEEVLGYINGLELTRKQKDALYLAFGWAESKLDEAPWN